jgi:hypothetical protein
MRHKEVEEKGWLSWLSPSDWQVKGSSMRKSKEVEEKGWPSWLSPLDP